MSRFDSTFINVLTKPDDLRRALREVMWFRFCLTIVLAANGSLLMVLLKNHGAWFALGFIPHIAALWVARRSHRSLISLSVALDPETKSVYFVPKSPNPDSVIKRPIDPVEEAFFYATEPNLKPTSKPTAARPPNTLS